MQRAHIPSSWGIAAALASGRLASPPDRWALLSAASYQNMLPYHDASVLRHLALLP